ncbi:MAG: hypothetical protein ABR928_20700 [Terracidiphilus sp.]
MALADRVTLWALVTADAVAVNPVLVALAGTVTLAGKVTAELLLERLTAKPPAGAAELSVTVHASVSDPVSAALVQLNPLNDGVTGGREFLPLMLHPGNTKKM